MKRLLVCTDGSIPYSGSCYDYAEFLAKKFGAIVDVLYVSDTRQFEVSMMADFSGSLGIQPYQNLYAQLQDIEKEKVKIVKKGSESFFKKAGILDKVRFHQGCGSLVDACHGFENDATGIDLVILGKRGENVDFAAEHLGSSMERVVRASSKPCLVVPRKFIPIKRMMIAYDGSPSANKVVQFLVRTTEFLDVKVDLVTVLDDDETDESGLVAFQMAEEALVNAGYSVASKELTGDVSDAISDYVVDNNIDLLAMGAYGHSSIKHLLIGSTTTDLIRRCKISVLLFR